MYKILGCHSSPDEDSNLVGCGTLLLDKQFLIFCTMFRILLEMLNPLQNTVCGFNYALLSPLPDDANEDNVFFTVRY
jgi:hypothetical protein